MKSVVFFSILVFLFCDLGQAQEDKHSFKEQYDVKSPAELKISSSDGDIRVLPGKEGVFEVYYIVYKNNGIVNISREELEEEMIIDIRHEQNLLDISVRNKKSISWRTNYDVSFVVYAPVETSCFLISSDGDIELSGLKADQKCRTSDGDIESERIEGAIDLVTSDGDIRAMDIVGDAELETSDGDVVAEQVEGAISIVTSDGDVVLKDVVGAIDAVTSDGDISFYNCSGSIIASTSDGDIEGNLLKVTHKVSLITSDGDIDLSIPEGIAVTLKLKGEDIRAPKLNFQGEVDEHHLEGEVNGGGVSMNLITNDGSVSLRYN